jgi:phosphatidylethanolamine/phosphatidyl-N-methylethanolamine N-methyltransferase
MAIAAAVCGFLARRFVRKNRTNLLEVTMALAGAEPHESKIYYEFSHLYDRIFTRFFFPRILSTIRSLNIPHGARILEVGVGTGLSLEAYPQRSEVTGIDLAPEMLEQARRKMTREGWRHIRLLQMNALDMQFPDGSFDYVTAFHVVSVVPDPVRLMREMYRVCKPGGTVVIINHFRSQRAWLAPLIDRLDPVTRKLGWRTTLRCADLFAGVPLEVRRRFKTAEASLFTVVIATKLQEAGACAAEPSTSG